ncbi:MAG: hypothetical protein A4E65_02441 [Syntrophorhabdus sp. PtaU1.Bin153]|nr:MAG: hypothetical protein A4E65_02441 [Syntrophorhabdus sp. PtaU1.Bin153]
MLKQPWLCKPLDKWSIVGMNHYNVNGKRRLFVTMAKNGKCIKEEGPDDEYLWNRLWVKAEEAEKKGTGYVVDEPCTTCNEEGHMIITECRDPGGVIERDTGIPCPDCKGTKTATRDLRPEEVYRAFGEIIDAYHGIAKPGTVLYEGDICVCINRLGVAVQKILKKWHINGAKIRRKE